MMFPASASSLLRRLAHGAAAVLVASLTAVVATAQDDRDTDTPTGAVWLTGRTIAQLNAQINAGWRITDLEYESTSSNTFTAALVRNSGAYAKGWWWLVGATASQVASTLSTNNARLIDLEPYDDNGTTRFAAVMVANTGADAKSWWWYYGVTSTQIASALSTNNARLVDLERYSTPAGERFACVMIRNTGADARGWSYYYGISTSQIGTVLNQNGMRPYSIERVGSNAYDLIAIQNGGTYHWYYYGLSSAQVTELLQQNVARIVDIESYVLLLGGRRYDVVMIDAANDLTRTAWAQFDTSIGGAFGARMEQIGGGVLADMRSDFVFEPASLMKTVYHTYAMRRVSLGLDSLAANVTVPLGTVGSCPNNNGSSTTERLDVVLRKMMENSDNNRTLAIANRYGVGNINSMAAALGMSRTSVNHVIGCGGPVPNELTLTDICELHTDVANGYLGAVRDEFYTLMADGLGFPTWGSADLGARINTEAAALGLPNYVRDAFRAAVLVAYKPGGYGINGLSYMSEGGFLRVPFKSASGVVTEREYAFGAFHHGASSEIPARNGVSNATLAMVWDRVRAALRTWDNPFTGSISAFGSSCSGTAGMPRHSGSGTPQIGSSVNFNVSLTPGGAPVALALGVSNTAWNGNRLPLLLDFLGATGCELNIAPLVYESYTATARGTYSRAFPLPVDLSLIGRALYTQYTVLDGRANPAGFTSTNGLRTTIGGYR